MASPLAQKSLPYATIASPLSFLYPTRTLSPVSLSICRSFSRRIGSGTDDSIVHRHVRPSSHEHSRVLSDGTSEQEPYNETSTTSLRPPRRMSYLRRRSMVKTSNKPRPEPLLPQTRLSETRSSKITPNERNAFTGLLEKYGPLEKDTAVQTEQKGTSNDRPSKADMSHVMQMFGDLMAEQKHTEKKAVEKPVEVVVEAPEPITTTEDELEIPAESSSGLIRLKDIHPANDLWNDEWENRAIEEKEAIDIIVCREVAKISDRLFESIQEEKGDTGIWEVCNQQVFSMIHSLDRNQIPSSNESSTKAAPDAIDIPQILPVESVVAELYPKLLLRVFRILGTYFPDSPIIGQFRTTMRAQGNASIFFGVSPALYDEMIIFSWNNGHDITAVVSLLHDMDNAGVTPSDNVRQLLGQIVQKHKADMRSVSKGGRHPFWDEPQNRAAFEELTGPFGWTEKSRSRQRRTRLKIPTFRPSKS